MLKIQAFNKLIFILTVGKIAKNVEGYIVFLVLINNLGVILFPVDFRNITKDMLLSSTEGAVGNFFHGHPYF